MRKINSMLITGGAGFIGSAFIRFIAQDNRFKVCKKIYILDLLTYAGKLENIKLISNDSRFVFIQGDINDANSILAEIETPDAIVHFAAESHVDRSIENGSPFVKTNIVGTFNLAEWARKRKVSIFLHISTDEVYGSLSENSATEESNLNPSSIYSASKASSDLIVLANFITHNQPIIITRCTNNYGPFQDKEKLIPKIILNASRNEIIPIYGTGLNVRDWLYVDDHVSALVAILLEGKIGQLYNISSDNEISNFEVAKEILQQMGKPLSLIQHIEDRKGHDLRYSLDSSKLRKSLGWSPETSFAIGIRKTINWYLTSPSSKIEVK